MIEVICESCGAKKAFSDDKEGKKFKCPGCGSVLEIKSVIDDKLSDFEEEIVGSNESLEESYRSDLNSTEEKLKGKLGWLIFWILFFWPGAIIYGLSRRWK